MARSLETSQPAPTTSEQSEGVMQVMRLAQSAGTTPRRVFAVPRPRNATDFLYGACLILVAGCGFWLSADLRIGSVMQMGPGYVPRALCWLLLGLGTAIAVRALLVEGEKSERHAFRPLTFVLLSVGYFGFAVEQLGLVVATSGLVAIAAIGDRQSRWLEVILLAVAISAFCTILFGRLLGLPIPLWPEGMP